MTRLRLATHDTFRSLASRNFRLFFVGQSISQIGRWLTLIAQTLLVLELTDSGVALGLLAAAQFGPVLLLGAWAGLVADRSDKRRLLIIVQSFTVAQTAAMAAVAFLDHPPLAGIYALAVLGGITTAFDNPARRSFVVEMVPEHEITNAVSLNSALMTGARIVGPAAGGLLVSILGYGWTFVLGAVAYLAVIAGLRMMDLDALRRAPLQQRGKGQIRAGFRYAMGMTELRVPLLVASVVGTLSFNFQTVLPIFATRDLRGSDLTFSLLMSVVSVGSLAGALAAARRSDLSVNLVSRAAIAFGVSLVALALAPNQPVAFALAIAVGITSITFMTTSTAIVQLRADPMMRGRVLALQSIVFIGSTPIGGPIVGLVTEGLGARYGLGLGAAGAVAAGLYGLATVRGRTAPSSDPSADRAGDVVPAIARPA